MKAHYPDLYEQGPVAFLAISSGGIIKATNLTLADLLGTVSGDLMERSIDNFIYQEDHVKFQAYHRIIFETGTSQTFEIRLVNPNGQIIWVQIAAALMVAEEPPVAWFALIDITMRKKTEDDLLSANQEIEESRVTRLEMNALQSQLKPHFIFNALSAAIALCYTDSSKAATLLTEFSRYLRLIFNVEDYDLGVTVKKTVELIKSYSALQKSRFGDRLNVIIEVDPALLNINMIPLVVEPLFAKAIRHGVSKKVEGGTVILRIKRLKDYMEILIFDDGIGMPTDLIKNLLSRETSPIGTGISNINSRVLKQSGKCLKIRSIEGRGTIVRVLLPLDLKIDHS